MSPGFDGNTFEEDRDGERLRSQLALVKAFALKRHWFTLSELEASVGVNAASGSARLRDLRKEKFGAYKVERAYRGSGTWVYRVTARERKQEKLF